MLYTPPSSLIFWLKADADVYNDSSGTDPCEDTESVYVWKDQTSNQYALSQATSGQRPVYVASAVYGKPGVSFAPASSQYLETSGSIAHGIGTGDFLFAAVYKTQSSFTDNTQALFSIGSYAPSFYVRNGSGDNHFRFYLSSPGVSFSDIIPSTSTTYLTLCGRDSGTIHAWSSEIGSTPSVSSSSASDSASIATNSFSVGNDQVGDCLGGILCELMLFNEVLDSSHWNQLVLYLNNKYAGTPIPTTATGASMLDF